MINLAVGSGSNDIALLKLSRPAVLDKHVAVIKLDDGACGKEGDTCTVKGWGNTNPGMYFFRVLLIDCGSLISVSAALALVSEGLCIYMGVRANLEQKPPQSQFKL